MKFRNAVTGGTITTDRTLDYPWEPVERDVAEPTDLGGGWYQTSDGAKHRGRDAAVAHETAL